MADRGTTREIVRELERQRWRVEPTAKGHFKAYPPDGRAMVTFGPVGNDPRAIKNIIAQLRRSGFCWPPANGVKLPQVGLLDPGDTVTLKVIAPEIERGLRALEQAQKPSVDELFAALKAARADRELHAELLAEAEKRWIEAERELAEARAALIASQRKLTETKAAFDAAFATEES